MERSHVRAASCSEGCPALPSPQEATDLSPLMNCGDSSTTGMLCSAHHPTRVAPLTPLLWPCPVEQGHAWQHPAHDTATRGQNPLVEKGLLMATLSVGDPGAPTRAAHGLQASWSPLTSARRRFSGFTRTLWATESSTSMALEFSLLILTRNCHEESAPLVMPHQGTWALASHEAQPAGTGPVAPPRALSGYLPRTVRGLYLDRFLVRLLCKVVDSQHLLLLGEGHREVQEGVKGDGHLQA